MKYKKYFIIIFILFCCAFFPNIANASVYRYELYNSSDTLLKSGTTVSNQSINVTGVRKIRFYFDNPVSTSNIYQMQFKIEMTRSDGVTPQFPNQPVIVVGQSVQNASQSVLAYDSQQQGAQSIYRSLTLQYGFTASSTNNGSWQYWQGTFGSDAHLTYLSITDFSISLVGTDVSAGTESIINNNNNNTQAILDSQSNMNNSINNVNDSVQDINDTLQDTSITGDSIGGKLADIESISDTPITDLITLPITLIQNIYNSINSSCSSYSLPFGFGLTNYTLTFPCIDLGHEKYLGRVVWGYVDDLFCIFMLFFLFKMVVWFFTNWSTLKDNFSYLIDPSNRGLF